MAKKRRRVDLEYIAGSQSKQYAEVDGGVCRAVQGIGIGVMDEEMVNKLEGVF